MKNFFLPVILFLIATLPSSMAAQTAGSSNAQPTEVPELTYHLTVMLPQYRFLDTSGNRSRVGEYDSLQQSLGGDLALHVVDIPAHLTFNSTLSVISRDDYDAKSRVVFGKWLDLSLENRGFVRHLDDNSNFAAAVISPDIIRTDSIPPDSLLGIRRRVNNFRARVQLPHTPVKLFIKGGWQARDGAGQMQYFDMGGSGQANDTQCDNCHSSSQWRTYNYTTRNIAGGAEVTLGRLLKLTYQHEFRTFNERMLNPSDFYGTAGDIPPTENVPYTPAGYYTHSVWPRHDTHADSLQIAMAVAHHISVNGNLSYARSTNLFTRHPQNAFNADTTFTWNPVSRLRAVVDFHQQNLLNDFVQNFSLSDPTILYPYGNPSLHRRWAGVRLAYRLSRQLDLETYYKRMNITRSNASLWPQVSSPDNADLLRLVPASFSNIVGTSIHFHSGELWDIRTGYEWTGSHNPGYLTDPRTNQRVFGDLTISPVRWLTFSNDASMILQRSFPVIQRSNHLYTNTSFVSVKPVSAWSIGAGYTYLQDNLRTDMQFASDPATAVYAQTLVPYKELSQTYSLRTTYELKQRVGLNVNFAHSAAHSGMRPDLNPADYPPFPGADPQAFSDALKLGAGLVSRVEVPQTLVGSTVDYHSRSGFDGGLRFNYGSYTDYIRPDLNGKLRAYSVFMGRTW